MFPNNSFRNFRDYSFREALLILHSKMIKMSLLSYVMSSVVL